MFKKIRNLFLVLLCLSSCHSSQYNPCPNIRIPRDVAYLTQKVNSRDEFQIELKGYEAYCYFDERNRRDKTVVTPIFTVQRLQQADDFEVDFEFFAETIKGPPHFLGRQNFHARTSLAPGEKEKEFKGNPITIRIPSQNPKDFEIILGLYLSQNEHRFNQRTFDIKYHYDDGETSQPISATSSQPISAESKQSMPATPATPKSSGCSSCGL